MSCHDGKRNKFSNAILMLKRYYVCYEHIPIYSFRSYLQFIRFSTRGSNFGTNQMTESRLSYVCFRLFKGLIVYCI